ncbi:MAG: hypothetical protein IPP74_06355 [Alphaproteobacteria bacterium]|nr:hypothetical protein [Alphaproteobacteria bacterium]
MKDQLESQLLADKAALETRIKDRNFEWDLSIAEHFMNLYESAFTEKKGKIDPENQDYIPSETFPSSLLTTQDKNSDTIIHFILNNFKIDFNDKFFWTSVLRQQPHELVNVILDSRVSYDHVMSRKQSSWLPDRSLRFFLHVVKNENIEVLNQLFETENTLDQNIGDVILKMLMDPSITRNKLSGLSYYTGLLFNVMRDEDICKITLLQLVSCVNNLCVERGINFDKDAFAPIAAQLIKEGRLGQFSMLSRNHLNLFSNKSFSEKALEELTGTFTLLIPIHRSEILMEAVAEYMTQLNNFLNSNDDLKQPLQNALGLIIKTCSENIESPSKEKRHLIQKLEERNFPLDRSISVIKTVEGVEQRVATTIRDYLNDPTQYLKKEEKGYVRKLEQERKNKQISNVFISDSHIAL